MNTKKLQVLATSKLSRLAGLMRYSSFAPPPFYLRIMLTYECNLGCSFCNQKELMDVAGNEELDVETLEKIEDNIDFPYKPKIHLFGGEPTVHENIEEVIDLFHERGYRVSMTTNGVDAGWMASDTMEGLDEINISVNTTEYSYVLEAVERINSFSSPPLINVNCPITPQNQNDLARISRDFKDLGISAIVFNHLSFSREETINEEIDIETVRSQKRKVEDMDIPSIFFPPVREEDFEEYYLNPSFPGTKCIAPWLKMEILPSGKVASCPKLVPDKDVVVGDATEENLSEVWNNEKFRQIRKRIHEDGVFEDSYCFRCCFRRYR
ncbi:MAG: radical SAM protein [Candidatus Nanohaloarchaeota archaeon QJJ-7]|nr:radical SAM protein [Candidatus Nanohaloarchaeota archaeon QJJ-7]